MPKQIIPRPGDVIRLLPGKWSEYRTREWVVCEAGYDNGISFSTHSFAWVLMDDCVYVRRATDKEYFAALRKAHSY